MLPAAAAVTSVAVMGTAGMWTVYGLVGAYEHDRVPEALCPPGPALEQLWGAYHHGSFVVLSVLILQEDVGGQSPHGVQKGKHSHGDKEFSRRGVVPHQEDFLLVPSAGGCVKVHLVQPVERHGRCGPDPRNMPPRQSIVPQILTSFLEERGGNNPS